MGDKLAQRLQSHRHVCAISRREHIHTHTQVDTKCKEWERINKLFIQNGFENISCACIAAAGDAFVSLLSGIRINIRVVSWFVAAHAFVNVPSRIYLKIYGHGMIKPTCLEIIQVALILNAAGIQISSTPNRPTVEDINICKANTFAIPTTTMCERGKEYYREYVVEKMLLFS